MRRSVKFGKRGMRIAIFVTASLARVGPDSEKLAAAWQSARHPMTERIKRKRRMR